jgi:hypothetical protein
MTARLAWARARRRWKLHTWKHTFFSDESEFSLRFSDERFRGELFTDPCVYESDCFGGGSVMIWTGICHDDRTQLKIVQGTLNAVKYRSDIIDYIVLPFLQQRKFDHVFNMKIQDVTSRGSCLSDFLNQNHTRVLPWPALSPDLSLIEHLWN